MSIEFIGLSGLLRILPVPLTRTAQAPMAEPETDIEDAAPPPFDEVEDDDDDDDDGPPPLEDLPELIDAQGPWEMLIGAFQLGFGPQTLDPGQLPPVPTCAEFALPDNKAITAESLVQDQEQSPLLVLHDELLSLVACYLGPQCSTFNTNWNAANLFSTCKRLTQIGKQATTRAGFLVGNYGTDVRGIGSWLGIVDVAVFEAVFRRLLKAQIPR